MATCVFQCFGDVRETQIGNRVKIKMKGKCSFFLKEIQKRNRINLVYWLEMAGNAVQA